MVIFGPLERHQVSATMPKLVADNMTAKLVHKDILVALQAAMHEYPAAEIERFRTLSKSEVVGLCYFGMGAALRNRFFWGVPREALENTRCS